MDISDEKELLFLLQKGDTSAFEQLFHQYHKRLYVFSSKLLPSTSDAEEIVQNVFMAVWNQRESLQIVSSIESYLFGIARHMIYNFIRQKIQHEAFIEYFLEHNQDYAFITEEVVLFRELEELLYELIQQLPERRREIFVLSRIVGLSYRKISDKLGISENTVDTQIRHALAFLRNKLTECRNS